MEESNFSILILQLKIAYQYYFKDMTKEETIGLATMYKEHLKEYDYDTINNALNKWIKRSKYMPTIADIIDECRDTNNNYLCSVIDLMYKDGYFHKGVENLTDTKANINYEKSINWIRDNSIPKFLFDDMQKYIIKNNKILECNNKVLIAN